MKRFITLLLCLACCLPLLFACGSKNNEPAVTSSDIVTEEPVFSISMADLANYKIVYPENDCPTKVFQKIFELQKKIKELYSLELTVKDDYYRENSKFVIEDYEILIGNTNRDETNAVLEDVKKVNDYRICLNNKKLVVAGISHEAQIEALDKLIELLPEANATNFFSPEMEFVYVDSSYLLGDLLLNGTSVSDYTVVYENQGFCKRIAEQIAEIVEERCGFRLTLTTDKAEVAEKEILIGKTNRPLPSGVTLPSAEGKRYVGSSENAWYLYGEADYSVLSAANLFIDAIKDAEGESFSVELPVGASTVENLTITSMSFNVWVSSKTDSRTKSVIDMIKKHNPDTLGVQEASVAWMNDLKSALGNEYACVGIGRDANGKGEHSAIFYKKDKFTLIESGTKWLSDTPDKVSKFSGSICNRIFTYAILERKSDNKQFMHINTHTDHTNDDLTVRPKQVKVITEFLKKYPTMPVIISGDFNDTSEQPSIQHMLSSGLDNSYKLALVGANDPTFSSKVIDYFFMSHNDFWVYEYQVDKSDSNGEKPSDHNPVIIRFDFAA